MKNNIPKIKISQTLIWQIIIVAFWVSIVILFTLNIYYLAKTKSELGMFSQDKYSFTSKSINKPLLNAVLNDIEKRKNIFEDGLLKKPGIADPSL